jgi:hypothetical protein
MYSPLVKGRIVTVRCLPTRIDEVRHGAWEVWGPLIPQGHNNELVSDQLVAYTQDPFVSDTLEMAVKGRKSVSVTVRDSPAGWQIEGCSL